MNHLTTPRIAALFTAATLLAASAWAGKADMEKDRQAILAMAGDYEVSFRFEETLTLDPDMESSGLYESGAHETVKVLADEGEFISLQHLLVVGEGEDQSVVKHWRQDWRYEPKRVLRFKGHLSWESERLSRAERKGAWSQTVYQVDDSPRYGGVGRWVHVGGYSCWQSDDTWRPLPRRERKRSLDYDVVLGVNRHGIIPGGWSHEQDNVKMALDDGEQTFIAREFGLNTYMNVEDYDFGVAEEYWDETAAFWAQVREAWDALETAGDPIYIAKRIHNRVLYKSIMMLADDYAEGELQGEEETRKAIDDVLAEFVSDEPFADDNTEDSDTAE